VGDSTKDEKTASPGDNFGVGLAMLALCVMIMCIVNGASMACALQSNRDNSTFQGYFENT